MVTFLQGKGLHSRGGAAVPLLLGQDVKAGDTVSTEPRGSLTLDDAGGNSLWMGGDSRLTVGPPADAQAPDSAFVFRGTAGDLHLDFRRAPSVEVVFPTARLIGRGATFRIMEAGGMPHVVLGEGELTVDRGGNREKLVRGKPVSLK
jgi:hypothetical protein